MRESRPFVLTSVLAGITLPIDVSREKRRSRHVEPLMISSFFLSKTRRKLSESRLIGDIIEVTIAICIDLHRTGELVRVMATVLILLLHIKLDRK